MGVVLVRLPDPNFLIRLVFGLIRFVHRKVIPYNPPSIRYVVFFYVPLIQFAPRPDPLHVGLPKESLYPLTTEAYKPETLKLTQ